MSLPEETPSVMLEPLAIGATLSHFTPPPVSQTEAKPGYKTTEFWATVVTVVGLIANILPAPQSKEGLYATIVVGVYALSRGLSKLGVANISAAFGATGSESELPGGLTGEQRAAL